MKTSEERDRIQKRIQTTFMLSNNYSKEVQQFSLVLVSSTSPLIAVVVDYSQAFDTTEYEKILHTLKKQGVENKYIRILKTSLITAKIKLNQRKKERNSKQKEMYSIVTSMFQRSVCVLEKTNVIIIRNYNRRPLYCILNNTPNMLS